MRVLWVTNDLPPRLGGIEQFVGSLLARVHPAETLVVGPAHRNARRHDPAQRYRVVRAPGRVLPTPRIQRLVLAAGRAHRPDVVVLGAAWPLGELAPALTRALGTPVVALTHGLEAALAAAGLGVLVRRASRGLAAATTISGFAHQRLHPHLAAPRVARVPPGVDVQRLRPGVDGRTRRAAWGVPADAPLVGCISRLVPRKGQDLLLAAWPRVRRGHPDAWLVLAGAGAYERPLRRRLAALGPGSQAILPGPVDRADLPAAYAALDVFAMPCRTRLAGLDVEGLGIVYLEAQASGVPVVAGRSGGAPEAVLNGRTGLVVDGRDREQVVGALDALLSDPTRRRVLGAAGRAWVEQAWSWDDIAGRFRDLLAEVVG